MENIAKNLELIERRIHAAAQKYGRDPGSVQLVAVSKSQPVEKLRRAVLAGHRDFGENYPAEAVPKIETLGSGLTWHFIGALQANKTRLVARHFDWVHGLDRAKTARRLSEARDLAVSPLNVCIQVNISGESSKSGVAPGDAGELAGYVRDLPGLRLRGLMVIPAPAEAFEAQRRAFREARLLLEGQNAAGHALDTLSMGMSGDFEAAIAEGATLVRIGVAIFGPRDVV